MRRITAPLIILIMLLAAVLVPSFATAQHANPEVRIEARRLDDGRTEFSLTVDGERCLPQRRFFPAEPGHDRWLRSSTDCSDAAAAPPSDSDECPTIQVGVNDVSMIPDGTECLYEFAAGEISYWARLSGFGGTIDEIIANDVPSCNATIVAIRGGDVGFEWVQNC